MKFQRASAAAMLFTAWTTALAAPVEIYDGSAAPTAQGWTKYNIGGTETVGTGTTQFSTTTATGGRTSEVQTYRLAVSSANFITSIRLRALAVDPHNQLDAGLMFSVVDTFQAPFGNLVNRASMLYIDSSRIGWADDTASAPNDATVFHDYVFRYLNGVINVYVDASYSDIAAGTATPLLTKNLSTSNNSSAVILFGDQTNDPNVDSTYVVDYVRYENLNAAPPAASPQSVSTLNQWGLVVMSAALALFGLAGVRRRR